MCIWSYKLTKLHLDAFEGAIAGGVIGGVVGGAAAVVAAGTGTCIASTAITAVTIVGITVPVIGVLIVGGVVVGAIVGASAGLAVGYCFTKSREITIAVTKNAITLEHTGTRRGAVN